MRFYFLSPILYVLLFLQCLHSENGVDLNLQLHYDIRRDFPTATQEFFATDNLGYTFSFIDVNFDHNVKAGGASDFYFELLRYFEIMKWNSRKIYLTIQYNDGSAPITQVWLAGLNVGDIHLGPFNISNEILLKKDYRLNPEWQYTVVWYGKLLNGKLVLNGYLDFWENDVNNPNWPNDTEIARSRFSLQAEPQVGWLLTPHWKIGSEVEIGRGFIGSVTGKLFLTEKYVHDKWYILPTAFIQYNF